MKKPLAIFKSLRIKKPIIIRCFTFPRTSKCFQPQVRHFSGTTSLRELQHPKLWTTVQTQAPHLIPGLPGDTHSHSAMSFPCMEPTATESTSIGYPTIATNHQGQGIPGNAGTNQSPKQRRMHRPVCLKTNARPSALNVYRIGSYLHHKSFSHTVLHRAWDSSLFNHEIERHVKSFPTRSVRRFGWLQ